MATIPCKYKDGSPVSPAEADMITYALLGISATATEVLIKNGENKRKAEAKARAKADEEFRAALARAAA